MSEDYAAYTLHWVRQRIKEDNFEFTYQKIVWLQLLASMEENDDLRAQVKKLREHAHHVTGCTCDPNTLLAGEGEEVMAFGDVGDTKETLERIEELEEENKSLKSKSGQVEDCLSSEEYHHSITEDYERESNLRITELEAENTRIRAAYANSDQPCPYCSLSIEDWNKCASGFPGCARADDIQGCPNLLAKLRADDLEDELATAKKRYDNLATDLIISSNSAILFMNERDDAREAIGEALKKLEAGQSTWFKVGEAESILKAALPTPEQEADAPKRALPKISEAPPIDITGGMDSVEYIRRIRAGISTEDVPEGPERDDG